MSLNVGLTYLNYRGLHIVGNVAIATAVFTLLPFVVISGLGAGRRGGHGSLLRDWKEACTDCPTSCEGNITASVLSGACIYVPRHPT